MNDKVLLAIDTATDQAGIALFDGSCLDEVAWTTCHDQTVNMLSQIDHMLRRADVQIPSIGAVAVTIGPGRFTALRVGLSIAKGLALAQEAAVIGVPTLDAVARPYQLDPWTTAAVIAAGRKRYAWSLYGSSVTVPGAIDTGEPATFKLLLESIDTPVVVTGEFRAEMIQTIADLPNVSIAPQSGRLGRAGAAAEIGWTRWLNGEVDDPVSLSPIYFHSDQTGKGR